MNISTAYLLANSGQTTTYTNELDPDLRTWTKTGTWFIYDNETHQPPAHSGSDATQYIAYTNGVNTFTFNNQSTDVRAQSKSVYTDITLSANTNYIFRVSAKADMIESGAGWSELLDVGSGRKDFVYVCKKTTGTNAGNAFEQSIYIASSDALDEDIWTGWQEYNITFNSGANTEIRLFIDFTEFRGSRSSSSLYQTMHIKDILLREA